LCTFFRSQDRYNRSTDNLAASALIKSYFFQGEKRDGSSLPTETPDALRRHRAESIES